MCYKQYAYAIKTINQYFHFSRAAVLRSDSPCDKEISREILQGHNTTRPGITPLFCFVIVEVM